MYIYIYIDLFYTWTYQPTVPVFVAQPTNIQKTSHPGNKKPLGGNINSTGEFLRYGDPIQTQEHQKSQLSVG